MTPTPTGLSAPSLVCLHSALSLAPRRRLREERACGGSGGPSSPLGEGNRSVLCCWQVHLPFAVVGSTEEVKIGNKMAKARQYPWGVVQGMYMGITGKALLGCHPQSNHAGTQHGRVEGGRWQSWRKERNGEAGTRQKCLQSLCAHEAAHQECWVV